MKINLFKISILLIILININNSLNAEMNYFNKGKNFFQNKNYEEAKFHFEKDIVFNPKSENSYLYLAKIFNKQEKFLLEEQNLETVLLINPKNEEAVYNLALLKIKKSNFSESEKLIKTFSSICKNLCQSTRELEKKLEDFSK